MSNWSGFGSVNCDPSAFWRGRIGDICSIKSTRAARIRDRRASLSAMISACSRFAGSAPLPQITVASWSIAAFSTGSRRIMAARPCRRALRRTRVFPAAVRGPVLRCELRRLAEIWRSGSRSGCGKPAFVEVAFNHLGGLSQPLCDVELKLRENPVPPKFRRRAAAKAHEDGTGRSRQQASGARFGHLRAGSHSSARSAGLTTFTPCCLLPPISVTVPPQSACYRSAS